MVLIAGVGYWGYDQYRENEQLQIYMGNTFQRSFFDLVERVEELQVLIGKGLASTSPRQNILLLTDVWSRANTAQAELNRLPLSAQTVYDVAEFLSKTGDFAHVMARQNADGQALTSEERQILNQLRQHAIRVVERLHEVQSDVLAGRINWVNMVRETRENLEEEKNVDKDKDRINVDDIRDEMSKVPVLIYDGPFSDHIMEREPLGLNGEEMSKDTLRDKVREIIDGDSPDVSVSEGTTVNGKISSYNFQVKTGNGVYSVDLAKKGGALVSLLNNRDVNSSKIAMDKAVDNASDYLARVGFPGMVSTYSEIKDNVAYISFAYQQEEVLFYPDIINVQIALDNGQVMAVEAMNYLMAHKEREIEKPDIPEEEARELASSTLDRIENIRLAVIPKTSLREVFTYEVRGNVGDEIYLIYINAKTGNEEEILKVITGEQGTFTL